VLDVLKTVSSLFKRKKRHHAGGGGGGGGGGGEQNLTHGVITAGVRHV